MRVAIATIIAFVAVVHAAPSDFGTEIELPKTANGILPAGVADKLIPVGAKPLVRVLDVGAEPRKPLDYAPVKGRITKFLMTMDMAMTMDIAGKNAAVSIPKVTMSFELKTGDKHGNDYEFDGKVLDVSVDASGSNAAMARELDAQIGKLKGLRMVYRIDSKGYIHDVHVDTPKDLPAAMQQTLSGITQSLQSLAMPLPTESVGTGARWQALMRTSSNGADFVQSVWITLVSRTAKTVKLDIKLKQLAASDHMAANGVDMKLGSLTSAGSGSVEIDLADAIAERGKLDMKLGMEVEASGMKMKMGMTMGVGVKRP
jgi:hypothetical protein